MSRSSFALHHVLAVQVAFHCRNLLLAVTVFLFCFVFGMPQLFFVFLVVCTL